MPWLNIRRRRSSKDLLVSFCVHHLLLDLCLRLVCFPSKDSLEKTKFPFASGFPLEIASGLEMSHVFLSPFGSRSPSGTDLCRPSVRCHSLYELICVPTPLCLETHDSLVSSITSDSNIHFSSTTDFPEIWGERFDGDIPFRAGVCFLKRERKCVDLEEKGGEVGRILEE